MQEEPAVRSQVQSEAWLCKAVPIRCVRSRRVGADCAKSNWTTSVSRQWMGVVSTHLPPSPLFFRAVSQAKAGILLQSSGPREKIGSVLLCPGDTFSQLQHPEGRDGLLSGTEFQHDCHEVGQRRVQLYCRHRQSGQEE